MGHGRGTLEGVEVNRAFWQGKRVLVTGHTGFKGSWLTLWLRMAGAQVAGYSLEPPTKPSLFAAAAVGDGIESTIADIRDAERIGAALRECEAEIVFHLAAQSLVRYSYANPVETYDVNVMGTAHLLEAVRQASGVRAVVVVTTDKCYENREWVWGYRESEAMGGHDPYSSSKGCAELVTAAFTSSYFSPADYASHGVAVATARAGNVIGGGDWAQDRLLPDMIRGIQQGGTVSIRNPNAIRPWQHVLEPLRGYLLLAEALFERGAVFNGGWNFGPTDGDAHPVSWIADSVVEAWGAEASWKLDDGSHPHEAHYLKLDSSKARTQLGWKPFISLRTALAWIVDWHKSCDPASTAPSLVRRFTENQINKYEELMQC